LDRNLSRWRRAEEARVRLTEQYKRMVEEAISRREEKPPSLEYIAGLLDGEGSITVQRSTYSKRFPSSTKDFYVNPQLAIVNSDLTVLKDIQKVLGGRIYSRRKQRPHHTLYWSKTEEILTVLSKLYPYLRIKRKQAELLMEFCLKKIRHGRVKEPYPPEVLELDRAIASLNDATNSQVSTFAKVEQVLAVKRGLVKKGGQ